jgi:predicted lactoylglutathione lyase
MAMLSYGTVGSNKLTEAKAFYDDGNPATVGNGSMLAFRFESPAEVDAFHAKALALGGTDEGAPGERGPKMYFSYFRDLDGNKLCAFCLG